MNGEDNINLRRIIKYIIDADSYTHGMSFKEFRSDSKTISATAFALSQIGDLVEALSEDIQEANPYIAWVRIGGIRNQIILDYEHINLDIVWDVLHTGLPELERQIVELLTREGSELADARR